MKRLKYLFVNAWKYSGEDRWKVVLFYILHTISYCGELIQPYAFGKAINALQANGIEDLSPTLAWLGVYLVGFFVFQIFHHSARYFEMTTAYRNQKRFINDMYHRICNLPMKWHNDHHSGEVVNRINVAGKALRDFGFRQYKYLGSLLLSLGPIIVLTSISWQISTISLLLTAINLVVVQKMNKAIQPILHKQNESLHTYSARLIDFVGNIKTIISLRLKERTSKELDRKFGDYYREHMHEFWINQPRCFISGLGGIVTELAIILYYIWICKMSQQLIMVGTLVSIVNYFKQMRDAFFEITNTFYDTVHWKASLQAVDPIVNVSRKKELPSGTEKYSSSWSKLSFRNLQFKYQEGQLALDNLAMDIDQQSKIAIVGLSGSGKSTLLNVLAGLYEPDQVQLLMNGKKYPSIDPLAHSTIMFPQDSEIFENSIQYNITFGVESEADELEKAINVAQLREVLQRLPKGLQTDIREKGVNLSGGEKQRLALARGLFFSRDKKILLLDEVTSNLDAFNERLVFQQILENYQDRCVISTVHRLHLLEMFDTVLVMEQGRIVQKGTFSELVSQEGHFKKLWEKYLVGDQNRIA